MPVLVVLAVIAALALVGLIMCILTAASRADDRAEAALEASYAIPLNDPAIADLERMLTRPRLRVAR